MLKKTYHNTEISHKSEYGVQVYHGSNYYIYSFCQVTEKTFSASCGSVGHCIEQ